MKISENRARSLADTITAQAQATHGSRWDSMTGAARTDAIKSKVLDFLLNQLHEEFEPAQDLVSQVLVIARPQEDEALDNLAQGPDEQERRMNEMMDMMRQMMAVVATQNQTASAPPTLTEVIPADAMDSFDPVSREAATLRRHNEGVEGGSHFGRVAQPMSADEDMDEASILSEFEAFNKDR